MGDNEWPTDRCRVLGEDLETFFQTAWHVSLTQDGAVVVSVDGVLQRQMVRIRDLMPDGDADLARKTTEYEDWMGSRHMSALDASRRPTVVATLTLSEETGRVSVFRDGAIESLERTELGGVWNPDGTPQ